MVCPERGYRNVLNAVRSCHDVQLTVEGNDETWDRLVLHFPTGTMVLTSMVRHAPGDKFSKLVLSMHNFFRTVETSAMSNKNVVLSRVENAKMMIGVIAEPEFSESDLRPDCLWRIAEQLDAVIFNGQAMLNLNGERIMAKDGQYDVQVTPQE
jgi:hypothetical protein